MSASNPEKHKLPVTMLRPLVDPKTLGFADTRQLPSLDETIGQERAVAALEFGLTMDSAGFNVYVAGPVGTGKATLIRQMVSQMAAKGATPPDWCYANNFSDPSHPICLSFPASKGREFKTAMAALIDSLRRDIPTAFESSKYLEAKAKIVEETEAKKKVLFNELAELGRERGFGFEETPVGFGVIPMKGNRVMTEKEIDALSDHERKDIIERRKALEAEIREFQVRLHALDHEAEQRVGAMDRLLVKNLLQGRFELLRGPFEQLPAVKVYLEHVHQDIVEHYKDFKPRGGPALAIPGLESMRQPDLTRYQINLIVEHRVDSGAPVIEESHPTYANLFGKIERKSHLGVVYTDFTEIRGGAFLQASGGYLILNALDLLRQPFAWDGLKRAIKTRELKIEDPSEFFGFSTTGMKPEPIPTSVKVILVGPPLVYHLLQAYEEDFQKIFKVKADFDIEVERDDKQDRLYAQFIARLCEEEHLPPFTADAVAAIICQGMRFAERHDKLSLRFSLVSDLIREAAFWARRENHALVSAVDVEQALASKRHRANLPEQWVQDQIKEGTLLVDLEGEQIGQVNGLSVHLIGDYAFGRPCRITARTFVGSEGVIDIQREAELSGHIHSKGVMTLAGFLAGKFAGAHPFALGASLTFEQTYSEIEGDSAAVAELAAILSSLADTPIRQELAVTGSVNQLGEIQPIGGVNEKVEGFFESCKAHGLTGTQGVIIPARNAKHLALRRDVVDAVKAGRFSVFGVNTVEEALELLTGLPAGERKADGQYPEDSLYGRAARRMAEMARIVANWGKPERMKREK